MHSYMFFESVHTLWGKKSVQINNIMNDSDNRLNYGVWCIRGVIFEIFFSNFNTWERLTVSMNKRRNFGEFVFNNIFYFLT